jgi:hypothetical protein
VRITGDHQICARADGAPMRPASFAEWLKRRGIGLQRSGT